jgi:hypothetical protein
MRVRLLLCVHFGPCRQLANVFQFRKAKEGEAKKADWQQEESAINVSSSSSSSSSSTIERDSNCSSVVCGSRAGAVTAHAVCALSISATRTPRTAAAVEDAALLLPVLPTCLMCPHHVLLGVLPGIQVLRASEAAAAELRRQQQEQEQLAAGGAVGQELAVSYQLQQ